MDVILTEDVPNVGDMGDIVKVSNGFGRNYLIPQRLALPVTGRSAAEFAHQKTQIERRKDKLRAEALEVVGGLQDLSVTIPRQVGDEDKLYGSVTNRDVQAALSAENFEIDRRKIVMRSAIRELGVYEVEIKLHADVRAKLRVWVTAI